jgi:hypothetical protein
MTTVCRYILYHTIQTNYDTKRIIVINDKTLTRTLKICQVTQRRA